MKDVYKILITIGTSIFIIGEVWLLALYGISINETATLFTGFISSITAFLLLMHMWTVF
jgi:hypothetical protein